MAFDSIAHVGPTTNLENEMANMSYCKFRNTFMDFVDCERTIRDHLLGQADEEDEIGKEELTAAIDMLMVARDLLVDMADSAEVGDVEDLSATDMEALLAPNNFNE